MKNYSAHEVFKKEEIELLQRATVLIEKIPEDFPADWERLRCHEVAMAVGTYLKLQIVDGKYGMVNHSWLLTGFGRGHTDNILDVYAVGRLPQVQLVDMAHIGPRHETLFVAGKPRTDVDMVTVDHLLAIFNGG